MDHPLFDNPRTDLPSEEQEEVSAQSRATAYKLPYINLKKYPLSFDVLKTLPLNEAQEFRLCPFAKTGRILKVAVTMPPTGPAKTRLVRLEQQSGYEIEMNIVSPGSLNSLFTHYANFQQESGAQTKSAEAAIKPAVFEPIKTVKTLADVQKYSQHSSTTDLLNVILAGAINNDASDIHIEPQANSVIIRYRLDGVLDDAATLPITSLHALISRIKIAAHLRLDQDQVPQDGSFNHRFDSIDVDFRISILPTQYGETVTVRIIRADRAFMPLESLGFSEPDRNRLEQAAKKSQGIIVASGPTGSGKTTTLYALLNLIRSKDIKIITLEDPIEYRLEGIQQSQINREEHYDFASGLREVLRQDPNVIMIGEIRDAETAAVAFDAAITGHLVLTTMHSPSAIQTFARLQDLGVKSNLMSDSINLVINQRLARRLCSNCQGAKCPECKYLGFKGRIVLAETLTPTPEFDKAILEHKDLQSLTQLAEAGGMVSIAKDAKEKVRAGITTQEDVERVSK